jgi:acyl carrier protein
MTRESAEKIVREALYEEQSLSPGDYVFECTFEQLRIDSLSVVQVCMAVEDRLKYDAPITSDKIDKLKTIEDLIKLVETYE